MGIRLGRRGLVWLAAGAFATGCGSDDTGGAGASDGGSTGGTVGGPAGDASDESGDTAGGDTDGPDSTGGSDDSDDADPDTGTGDTAGMMGTQLTVLPSSMAVLEDDDEGTLTVRCVVTEDGLPVAGGEGATVTVSPSDGVTETDGVYTFAEFGLFDVTCDAEVDGEMLTATQTIAVLNEAIDPAAAQLGAGVGTALDGIAAVIASDGLDDELLVAAVERLDAALPLLAPEMYEPLDDLLRRVPGGYPEGADLDGMGIVANADDAALPGALTDLDAALASYEAVVAGFDPDDPTQEDADALDVAGDELETALNALLVLEPTAHGLVGSRTQAAGLMKDRVAPTTHTVATWVGARARSEAVGVFSGLVGEPDPQGFGFLSLTIGMFGKNNLQIQLINKWYGKYIAQLDESINNFILAGGINYYLPLADNPPVIDLLVASASPSFATPGYQSWIDGSGFNENPELNHVLVFGDSWQGIIDNIFNACGIEDVNTLPEKLWVLRNCIMEIDEAVQSIFVTPISVGPGIYGSPQGVDIGEFPEVCSGGLPTATFLLPINYDEGRGEPYFVNCI
ncbi:MAG: hypothetical protein AAF721_38995 [Myxococcota bacterium]